MLYYNKNLKNLARNLRKNMTDAERLLWSKLRCQQLSGYKFYRQKPIGEYIVDFYCAKAKLAIEIDGGHHYYGNQKRKDEVRDKFFQDSQIKVLRFSDREVFENLDGVVEKFWMELK